jgi:hypothetical protein
MRMDHRNPDRISIIERRPSCETVEAMIVRMGREGTLPDLPA